VGLLCYLDTKRLWLYDMSNYKPFHVRGDFVSAALWVLQQLLLQDRKPSRSLQYRTLCRAGLSCVDLQAFVQWSASLQRGFTGLNYDCVRVLSRAARSHTEVVASPLLGRARYAAARAHTPTVPRSSSRRGQVMTQTGADYCTMSVAATPNWNA
jgi:hypothetical protein